MRYRRVRNAGGTYFFTVVTYKRQRLFETDEAVSILMAAVATVQAAHSFDLVAHVILPDHLHMLWTLPDGDSDYPMRWRLIKSEVTRKLTGVAGDVSLRAGNPRANARFGSAGIGSMPFGVRPIS